jgi:hypothetical protein
MKLALPSIPVNKARLPYFRAVLGLGAIVFVLSIFDADLYTILKLSLTCFVLCILPGSLLVHTLLNKSLWRVETWLVGTALGMNLLPVLFKLAGYFTTDATLAWPIVIGAIVILNIQQLWQARATVFVDSAIQDARNSSVPFLIIVLFSFTFLGFYSFQCFGRDLHRGVYSFNPYFGGDIPFLSAMTESFQRSTISCEWHYGNLPKQYHDFTFRFIAGLRSVSGGDIYDAMWYWLTSFDTLLLLSLLFVVTKKLIGDRNRMVGSIAASIAVTVFFLFPGKMFVLYATISDSFKIGVVEGLLVIYLFSEYITSEEAKLKKTAAALFWIIGILVAFWKVTDTVVILPAFCITTFFYCVHCSSLPFKQRWAPLGLSLATLIVGLVAAKIAYQPMEAVSGTYIIGRPLVVVNEGLVSLFGASAARLTPVMPTSHLTFNGILSVVLLTPIYLLYAFAQSGRVIISLLLLPKFTKRLGAHSWLTAFTIGAIFCGYLFEVVASPEHYFYGDLYQPLMANVIATFGIAIVVSEAWCAISNWITKRRSNQPKDRKSRGAFSALTITILVVALFIEGFSAVRAYHYQYFFPKSSVPIALLTDLQEAGKRTPPNAMIATRRFNLNVETTAEPLGKAHDMYRTDWNFAFYATALGRPVALEAPADGFFGAVGIIAPNPKWLLTRNPYFEADLQRRSRLLDTIYDSQDAAKVIGAADSLGASHILIDKTIHQHIAQSHPGLLDTVFEGKYITLLKVRR